MQECLKLARKGAGFVGSNPMVGCVIVKGGEVIGRGYYKKFGGDHAEVMALKNAIRKKKKVSGATVYLTLEPHSFHGKTPPCTDALINAKVKKVIIGTKDPNPKVAGQGIAKLKEAGIKVEIGVLEKECKGLIETFAKYIVTGQPFVLLKIALTKDFALSLKKGERSKLSSEKSNKKVQQLRQAYDAIGVGVNTVLVDNPLLTCRLVTPSQPPPTRGRSIERNPTRIIFDTKFKTSEKAKLLKQPGGTIIFVGEKFSKSKKNKFETEFKNVRVVEMPLDRFGNLNLKKIFAWLGKNKITSIMIEGGAKVANEILQNNLADKVIAILTPHQSEDKNAPRIEFEIFKKYFEQAKFEKVGEDIWMVTSV